MVRNDRGEGHHRVTQIFQSCALYDASFKLFVRHLAAALSQLLHYVLASLLYRTNMTMQFGHVVARYRLELCEHIEFLLSTERAQPSCVNQRAKQAWGRYEGIVRGRIDTQVRRARHSKSTIVCAIVDAENQVVRVVLVIVIVSGSVARV